MHSRNLKYLVDTYDISYRKMDRRAMEDASRYELIIKSFKII